MTPEERQQMETQIKNDSLELQKRLGELQDEIKNENDEDKKKEKNDEIQKLESELESLKTKLEDTKKTHQEYGGETAELQNEKSLTPTTYELLKDSETYNRLLNIISSNPNEFKNLPGDTAEKKLEYIFSKIRNSTTLFMKNKLGGSEKYNQVITNTIAPAFEWSLMELLRDQGNETNVSMLQGIDKIGWNSFGKLVRGVSNFATKASGSYNVFNQWINAVDYLSVHNGVLNNPEKSAVLTDPIKFQSYINNPKFRENGFSPYKLIEGNIFEISDEEKFEFGISLQEKQSVLAEIGQIQVVNNPKTTALIVKMIDKPEQFLQKTEGLQQVANGLLDGVNSINSVTRIFGVDILGEITKAPEKRSFLYRIIDFVCKLIGITGGLEGIVKRWRLDRMNLTEEKNNDISKIFNKYKEYAGENTKLSIIDENSCKTALADFTVTDPQKNSTTKGDFLRDSIANNMDVSLISPSVVQQILGTSYLRKETIQEKGKTKEIFVVDKSKITEADKLKLAHNHLVNMKAYLEVYKDEKRGIDLSDFYKNITSTEDIALCITASLYADRNDVIDGVKASVFLPENYGSFHSDGTVDEKEENPGRENLDSVESSDKQIVTEQRVYDKAVENGITDNRQIAYVLSTVKGESGFKNQPEIGRGEGKRYGAIDQSTGQAYYGRGFVQLTWKGNYEKFTQIIRNSGRDFKDNNGNIIKGSEVDLVNNPDMTLQSNDLAAFILMYGMKNGSFTGKKLDDFINSTGTDFYNARSIINGMSSKPKDYADEAKSYLDKINNNSDSSLA